MARRCNRAGFCCLGDHKRASEGRKGRRRTIGGVEGCEEEIHGTWRLGEMFVFCLFTRDFPRRDGSKGV